MSKDIYSALSSIGISVYIDKEEVVDIEETIILSLYHFDTDDRIAGLIFSWFNIYHSKVNADKLFRTYKKISKEKGESPWFSGVCNYALKIKKDFRFKKGAIKPKKIHYFRNDPDQTLIKIKGAVDFLEEVGIKMASSSLRIRDNNILSYQDLCRKNKQMFNRFKYGPNWRAEMMTNFSRFFNVLKSIAHHQELLKNCIKKAVLPKKVSPISKFLIF